MTAADRPHGPLPVLLVVAGGNVPLPVVSISATPDPLVPPAVMSLNSTLVKPPPTAKVEGGR